MNLNVDKVVVGVYNNALQASNKIEFERGGTIKGEAMKKIGMSAGHQGTQTHLELAKTAALRSDKGSKLTVGKLITATTPSTVSLKAGKGKAKMDLNARGVTIKGTVVKIN